MRKTVTILCLLPLVLCGCGTLATHGNWPATEETGPDEPSSGVYRGVRDDCISFSHVQGSPGGLIILDLPFSIVADTVMLHHDLKADRGEKLKTEKPQA